MNSTAGVGQSLGNSQLGYLSLRQVARHRLFSRCSREDPTSVTPVARRSARLTLDRRLTIGNGNGFQFSKGLSIGHVITTVALAAGMMGFAFDLRESVAILQFKGETVEQRLERAIERTDNSFDEIMDHLIRLEEKIDDILLANNPMDQKGAR